MTFASWIKDIFNKRKQNKGSNYLSVKEAKPGQIVELRFHDPRKIGIQSPSGKELSITRFNHDELDNRTIRGFVKQVSNWEGGPNYGWYIVVESKKGHIQRDYLFLEHEVDWMRVID